MQAVPPTETDPAGQVVQAAALVDPAGAEVPGPHAVQEAESAADQLPAGHCVHELASAAE